jgi:hypothetical protein
MGNIIVKGPFVIDMRANTDIPGFEQVPLIGNIENTKDGRSGGTLFGDCGGNGV